MVEVKIGKFIFAPPLQFATSRPTWGRGGGGLESDLESASRFYTIENSTFVTSHEKILPPLDSTPQETLVARILTWNIKKCGQNHPTLQVM